MADALTCPACGQVVPRGRFSCQACGSLLAPVVPLGDGDPSEAQRREAALPPPGSYLPPTRPVPDAGDGWTALPRAGAAIVSDSPIPIVARAWGPEPESGPVASIRLETAKIDEASGWITVAGSMAAVIGFLLPWSSVVIGARGFGGYVDTWGLAGPLHPLLCLAALVTFGLAAAPNPVPAWFRSGLLSLTVGALLLGVVWPYVVGPLGAGPGAILVAVGAVLLVAAGVTTGVIHRHAVPRPA
jgi:hypothetical protein